jgi:nitrogen-specific signal transduction histidine kinase
MFFKRKESIPVGYAASNFLLTYFIVGLLILSLAFVFYTKQILQLNRDLDRLVEPLVALAAELPAVEDVGLQNRLSQVFRHFLAESRLSFVITDAKDERVMIARGTDPSIERKLNSEPPLPLSPAEQSKLRSILERMKRNAQGPKQIGEREFPGYIYYGETGVTAVAQIPFVITDLEHKPQKWQIWSELVTAKDATPSQYAQAEMLVHNSQVLGRYAPLSAKLQQGYLYFDTKPYYALFIMPVVLVLVFSTFLAVGFLSYRHIKSCEQAAIWGGLARETAHQLGTPISSLMGWVELLGERNRAKPDEMATEIYASMHNDLVRLQKITARFGTVGSYPRKTAVDINTVVRDVVAYFRKRLPNRSRQIEIHLITSEIPKINANADLLQWVFENLIRNSLDAINKKLGLIEIDVTFDQKKQQIVIQYRDNGSGIQQKDRNKIFMPGVTTKKHGWGVGLTVARRVIEEYHHGQIRLVETSPSGTVFEVVLPIGE